jgi:hypothetical protein
VGLVEKDKDFEIEVQAVDGRMQTVWVLCCRDDDHDDDSNDSESVED